MNAFFLFSPRGLMYAFFIFFSNYIPLHARLLLGSDLVVPITVMVFQSEISYSTHPFKDLCLLLLLKTGSS